MNSVAQLILPGHRPKRPEATIYTLQRDVMPTQRPHHALSAWSGVAARLPSGCLLAPTFSRLHVRRHPPGPYPSASGQEKHRTSLPPLSRASAHSTSSLCCTQCRPPSLLGSSRPKSSPCCSLTACGALRPVVLPRGAAPRSPTM
jgi:hypothetical protein